MREVDMKYYCEIKLKLNSKTQKNIQPFKAEISQLAEDWQKFWNSANFLELVFIASLS